MSAAVNHNSEAQAERPTTDVELAGRLRRLGATLIDAILVPALTIVLVMVTGVVEDAEDYIDATWTLWVLLLAVVSYLLLNGVTLWRRGQTLGKWLTGIAIVRADALGASHGAAEIEPAPFWKLVCIRALFFPLLFLVLVPWITLLPLLDQLLIFRRNRRCLHDLAAGTIVVRRRNR
jgi:uncharacterized RDD family membrane protein YckC